jgi:hypothetical protein
MPDNLYPNSTYYLFKGVVGSITTTEAIRELYSAPPYMFSEESSTGPAPINETFMINAATAAITMVNPSTITVGTYTLYFYVPNSAAFYEPITVIVTDPVNLLPATGIGSGAYKTGTNLPILNLANWKPLTLQFFKNDGSQTSPSFFGAATSMSCLFSGQSYLSENRINVLQNQVNSLNALSSSALNSLSTNTTLYLKDFATEFNAFKGQITSSLASTISALALDEIQDGLLQSSISQLSNVEGSLFSAIAQKASLMTQNLTLAYTRNFVNVLLSVYPLYNNAGDSDNLCTVNDFFPEIDWGTTAPTLNPVSYVSTDAYMTADVVTATANNISSNTQLAAEAVVSQNSALSSATTDVNAAAIDDMSVTSGTNLSDSGVV